MVPSCHEDNKYMYIIVILYTSLRGAVVREIIRKCKLQKGRHA